MAAFIVIEIGTREVRLLTASREQAEQSYEAALEELGPDAQGQRIVFGEDDAVTNLDDFDGIDVLMIESTEVTA